MIDLKAITKDLKLSQLEISQLLGVSQTAISMVSNGKMDFPSAWEQILIDKLGIDISKYYLKSDMVSEYQEKYVSKKEILQQAIINLSESNKLLSESNKILAESNKMMAKTQSEMMEWQQTIMSRLSKKTLEPV